MIHFYEEFRTKQEAERERDRIYMEFHPCGYGTFVLIQQNKEGTWMLTGHRYASCD